MVIIMMITIMMITIMMITIMMITIMKTILMIIVMIIIMLMILILIHYYLLPHQINDEAIDFIDSPEKIDLELLTGQKLFRELLQFFIYRVYQQVLFSLHDV